MIIIDRPIKKMKEENNTCGLQENLKKKLSHKCIDTPIRKQKKITH